MATEQGYAEVKGGSVLKLWQTKVFYASKKHPREAMSKTNKE